MAVRINRRSKAKEALDEDMQSLMYPKEEPDSGKGRLVRVIEQVSAVNAVDGLRETISIQQSRVNKLLGHEAMLPYTLDQLTVETRLLKEMYNDVIRFQTSASVLAHLKREADHRGIGSEELDFMMDMAMKEELREATVAALNLLNKD